MADPRQALTPLFFYPTPVQVDPLDFLSEIYMRKSDHRQKNKIPTCRLRWGGGGGGSNWGLVCLTTVSCVEVLCFRPGSQAVHVWRQRWPHKDDGTSTVKHAVVVIGRGLYLDDNVLNSS